MGSHRLKGTVAIVTGGGQGIGAGIARIFPRAGEQAHAALVRAREAIALARYPPRTFSLTSNGLNLSSH